MQGGRGVNGPARALDPDLYEDAERIIASFASAARMQSPGAFASASASSPGITASDVRPLMERPGERHAVDDGTAETVAQRTTSVVHLLTDLAYQLFTVREGRTEIQRRDIEGALQILAKRRENGRSTSTAQVPDPDDSEAGLFVTGGSQSEER